MRIDRDSRLYTALFGATGAVRVMLHCDTPPEKPTREIHRYIARLQKRGLARRYAYRVEREGEPSMILLPADTPPELIAELWKLGKVEITTATVRDFCMTNRPWKSTLERWRQDKEV